MLSYHHNGWEKKTEEWTTFPGESKENKKIQNGSGSTILTGERDRVKEIESSLSGRTIVL